MYSHGVNSCDHDLLCYSVIRATLHDFFRTEDRLFREMLLEEEHEGAHWQATQVRQRQHMT
jgi:hypothetical protein